MNNDLNKNSNGDLKKLGDLIKDIRVTMMTTVNKEGALHSRPMMSQEIDANGCLWFFTSSETGKADSIENDQRVNLGFAKPDDSKYISVAGTARIVKDEQKAKELWKPAMRAWFPEGVKESDLVLIQVQVETAEYWDAPKGGEIAQLAKMTKAIFTQQPYESSKKENGRINLQ